ncbi:peptidoglycan-binding domain-containing protein [Virgisporangium aliadipatigenens]|nr:peptidoglycan-binding domain-containing protein [Virgisporangium aliadipatigenens]
MTLVGLAAATVVLLRPAPAPAELRASADATAAPVGHEEFADERTVKVAFRRAAAPPLTVAVTGRVTETGCAVGKAIESGKVVARVDGKPVLALATSVPLYRDLRLADVGTDVRALQQELRRLGYRPERSGTYGASTVQAVKALQKAAGVKDPDGALVASQVLWLPAPSVLPDTCELVLGAYLAGPAQVFAKVAATLTAIVVEAMPPGAVAGERTIRMAGVTGPLGADGTATDPELLAKVSASAEYRAALTTEKPLDVTAVVSLKERLKTVKVPPGALFAVDGDKGCVQSGAATYPVRIVSSRLGAALVVPVGEPFDSVNLGASITAASC